MLPYLGARPWQVLGKERYQPGEEVAVDVAVQDTSSGSPQDAQVVLTVVDKAILDLVSEGRVQPGGQPWARDAVLVASGSTPTWWIACPRCSSLLHLTCWHFH